VTGQEHQGSGNTHIMYVGMVVQWLRSPRCLSKSLAGWWMVVTTAPDQHLDDTPGLAPAEGSAALKVLA
jgi:hypothetical protein